MEQSAQIICVYFIILLFTGQFPLQSRAERDPSLSGLSTKLSQLLGLQPVPSDNSSTTMKSSHNNDIIPDSLKDKKHGIKMGVVSEKCDNAKVNLTMDWDGSPVNYTCYSWKLNFRVREDVEPTITCDTIPSGNYLPPHYCMDTPVHYHSLIPTYEGHRPLWPIFGEYRFVPPQRWLHNIEHGAIVMLYHPCAELSEVLKLKKLVKSCLWKYVITPWNMLPRDQPFALVAWGCRLQMSKVDLGVARYFIRSKAFHGPEDHYLKQGQYSVGLIEASDPPSDPELDKVLC